METKRRSIMKALSWRIIASLITGSLVFTITRQGVLALSVGALDSIVKILVYYFHERFWMSVSYGRVHHPLQQFAVLKPLAAEHEAQIKQKLNELGYLPD